MIYIQKQMFCYKQNVKEFRNVHLEHFRSDPCYYFSNPGLSWDERLKLTG